MICSPLYGFYNDLCKKKIITWNVPTLWSNAFHMVFTCILGQNSDRNVEYFYRPRCRLYGFYKHLGKNSDHNVECCLRGTAGAQFGALNIYNEHKFYNHQWLTRFRRRSVCRVWTAGGTKVQFSHLSPPTHNVKSVDFAHLREKWL